MGFEVRWVGFDGSRVDFDVKLADLEGRVEGIGRALELSSFGVVVEIPLHWRFDGGGFCSEGDVRFCREEGKRMVA